MDYQSNYLSEENLRQRATNNLICRCMEKRFRLHPDESSNPDLVRKWLDLSQEAADQQVKRWFHVTISGSSSFGQRETGDFFNLVQKVTTQKHVLQGIWTPEFCTEDGSPGHPHAHCVIQSTYSKENLIRRLAKVMGLKPNFIHVLPKHTALAVKNALIYVQKNRGPDSVWRLSLGLPPLTYLGDLTESGLREWTQ